MSSSGVDQTPDPALPSNANALLRAHGLRPRKRWGQNFLCDRNVIDRIVGAAALTSQDRTLEIGAGLGSLTRSLADLSMSVTAIEIDRLLEPILRRTLAGRTNIRVIYEDFLRMDLPTLLHEAFGQNPGMVVGNIPYYITTPILERLFEQKPRIRQIVLTLQHEVAERLAARAGSDAYGSMSVFAQYHSKVEIVGRVPRTVFIPSPDVESAIVRLTPVIPGTVEVKDEAAFFHLVRAGFGQRRKTLSNSLASGETGLTRESALALLEKAAIDPGRRAETLDLEEFARLADSAD